MTNPQVGIHKCMKVWWLVFAAAAAAWQLWTARNEWVFNRKSKDLMQIMESINVLSFEWVRVANTKSVLSYHDWWTSGKVLKNT